MSAFIKGAAILSPQKTFDEQGFPEEITDYANVSFLRCIEPVYRDFIDPMVARRMSRIVKMGMCSALKCMRDAGVEMPDAIIAGTGLGCLEDTEKFLGSIITNHERLLNPTPFIQSTHNTLAGAIALSIKCHNYNATYTHRGFSFECALEDALLQLAENPTYNILTGGFDEITENSYAITKRLGLWKNSLINNLALTQHRTRGSLPGEGVAFFMLSGQKSVNDLAVLKSVRTFYKPQDHSEIEENVEQFLADSGLKKKDIHLVMLGINGDVTTDKIYYQLMEDLFSNLPGVYFKHLCGEYDTSSSFAMWLASLVIKQQQVPACIRLGGEMPGNINNILIYNHLRGVNHSLYLLERC
jgi:3-oxoacyl-[acyl-carrier-protein] synthase II